ncbi:hypothetical protein [Methylobacterium sp. J-068]|uniref:hypothetical protein n=1 Tax=Methylobacterium sp. J-068 TaxID=2836649 RepID=UPI001FBB4E37|nr:hypothetical protein [Methylobacterium sp. J-068]MCJ2033609.1 hypothetical protein [Methylobacterium sp. J-068]
MPPKAQDRAGAPSEIAGDQRGGPMNTDNVQMAEDEGREHQDGPEAQASEGASPVAASLPVEAPEPNVHETLLESVSPEAIVSGGGGDAGSEHPAHRAEPDAADDDAAAAPLADDLTIVPEEAAEPVPLATETVEAAGAAAETVARAVPETIAESLPTSEILPAAAKGPDFVQGLPVGAPDLGKLMDLVKAPRIAEVMGELGEVNATVLTYLRGEGTAALAHWQALAGARTPADAIRIQVDEMQRAADASLTCFTALARRASHFTSVIGKA